MIDAHRRSTATVVSVVFACVCLLVMSTFAFSSRSRIDFSYDPAQAVASKEVSWLYSGKEIIQQVHDWQPKWYMPSCDTRDPSFIKLDDWFATGFTPHPRQVECEEMRTWVHTIGFDATIVALHRREVLVYAMHHLTQMIAVDGLDDGVNASVIWDAFFTAKYAGLCYGPLVSGGVEHGMEWAMVSKAGLSWEQIIEYFQIEKLRPSTRYQAIHGAGHGMMYRAHLDVIGESLSPCSKLYEADERKTLLASGYCLAAPREDYRQICGDGIYHSAYSHPTRMSLAPQRKWAHLCEITPLSYGCFHFGMFFLGMKNPEVFEPLMNDYPTMSSACTMLDSGEYNIRACIFGLTATFYPVYQSLRLSPNFERANSDGAAALEAVCREQPFERDPRVMKVKMYGFEDACALMCKSTSSNPLFTKISSPAPMVDYCKTFLPKVVEGEGLNTVAWRRLQACVRGAVHFTTDTDINVDYCAGLQHAPESWRPAELVTLCRRSLTWDFQTEDPRIPGNSTWIAMIDDALSELPMSELDSKGNDPRSLSEQRMHVLKLLDEKLL